MKRNKFIPAAIFFMMKMVVSAQVLPVDQTTGKITFADLIVFDTINTESAYKNLVDHFKNYPAGYCENLITDDRLHKISFTFNMITYYNFPKEFGKVQCAVKIRCLKNQIGYNISDFKHVPTHNFPPCSNNLEVKMPDCFLGKTYAYYWADVKSQVFYSTREFIYAMVGLVIPKDQPAFNILKCREYKDKE